MRSNVRESVGTHLYIEYVFENDLVELDVARTLAAAEANEHALIIAETRRLQIAAHWADLHPGEAIADSRLPGTERPVRLGGDGTPTVGDFAAAELGCVLRMSDGSALGAVSWGRLQTLLEAAIYQADPAGAEQQAAAAAQERFVPSAAAVSTG
jgi:hypothetical protein